MQHPSDPVVWWSPRLMFNSPEWLRETRDNTALHERGCSAGLNPPASSSDRAM
ncbi:alpha/beta-hydrolase family protein [Dermacoccus nishinomiyaensis]|uniref:alpha/beta-hydrolase family protein n=1 Tax=Dermacoccus nishinomiyaensis TaxID=1274 RepID=UPI0009E04764|nr:alpha/beta-hydrolase family protein [Dermacoccus nishinomiyaensis]